LSATLPIIAMKSKTKSSKLGLTATMLLLTACAKDLPVPARYLYPPNGILDLKKGQQYTAQNDEKWHSEARYQKLELDYLNAIAAKKQSDHR
jgi:hypothetical protein